MESLFKQFIFVLIWFVAVIWIGIPKDLLYWIPSYLCQDLTVVSNRPVPAETMCMFNKDWKFWIRYGQVPFQKSLIEHDFAYPVKLGICTTVQVSMEFLSIFINVAINNDVLISKKLMWMYVQRESEDDPYL